MIKLKRVYEPAQPADGTRFLVERLWPRWDEFRSRYAAELDGASSAWRPIVQAARTGTVTLLFSSHDRQHNNAVALKAYLAERSKPDSNEEP